MENLDFLVTYSLSAHMLTANSTVIVGGIKMSPHTEPSQHKAFLQCVSLHTMLHAVLENRRWIGHCKRVSKHQCCTNDLCNLFSCTDMNSHCSVSSGLCNCSTCSLPGDKFPCILVEQTSANKQNVNHDQWGMCCISKHIFLLSYHQNCRRWYNVQNLS